MYVLILSIQRSAFETMKPHSQLDFANTFPLATPKSYTFSTYCKSPKMAIRIICNLTYREHTSPYFKELNILKFMDLVKSKILLLMFKAKNVELPTNLQSLFAMKNINNYKTRNQSNFVVNYSRCKIKSSCLSIIGVRLWNAINNNLKQCDSVVKFKTQLKKSYVIEY